MEIPSLLSYCLILCNTRWFTGERTYHLDQVCLLNIETFSFYTASCQVSESIGGLLMFGYEPS